MKFRETKVKLTMYACITTKLNTCVLLFKDYKVLYRQSEKYYL